ncbi:MAG TPA: hypothetical protein PKO05_09975, partial [Thermoanaerobaculia bacterium]|nr:hypothetical protein [Thermoanaerobaculia bacterium]
MSDHLETIVSLQHHLTVEKETERQLAGIPAWMRDLHDEHSRAQAEIDALHAVAQAAGQKRRAAEAGIARILRARSVWLDPGLGPGLRRGDPGAMGASERVAPPTLDPSPQGGGRRRSLGFRWRGRMAPAFAGVTRWV